MTRWTRGVTSWSSTTRWVALGERMGMGRAKDDGDRPVMLHASRTPAAVAPDGLSDEQLRELRVATTGEVADLLSNPPGLELTSSCTHAMEAAAAILGIGPGDEVIVPAFTFPSTANAFLLGGATVRFADVDLSTGNIDPKEVERTSGPRTRAVVCTHYGGVACDMDALEELRLEGTWHLVEDAAHGIFGSYRGTALGRFGTFGALSFHRTKNLSAVDGGAIVVNRGDMVEAARVAVDKGTNRAAYDQGRVTSYEWSGLGSAWRMSDPMVELLAAELEQREQIQKVRQHVWSRYRSELAEWAARVGASLAAIPEGCEHPAHLFHVVLPEHITRTKFVAHCADQGVQVVRHYGSLPDSRYGRSIRHPEDACPRAALLGKRLVRLPLHHQLSDDDVDRVIEAVTSV